jgi:hypothetical protein
LYNELPVSFDLDYFLEARVEIGYICCGVEKLKKRKKSSEIF